MSPLTGPWTWRSRPFLLSPLAVGAAAAGAITLASSFGIPWTTTHAISASPMEVAAARRTRAVRWTMTRELVGACLLAFPVCAAVSWTAVKSTAMLQ